MEKTTVKQNPLLFYLRMFLYTLIALVLRLAALAPLAARVVDRLPSWLALLCPVLFLFVVMPLRFSFGDAMAQRRGERFFDFRRAFSLADYGEKLSQSLMHALHVAKWGLPLAAMGLLAFYWYQTVDALTVFQTVTEMGRLASQTACTVANLFGAGMTPPANTLMDGVFVVLGIVGAGVAVWAWGAVRNSATRYIWAIAVREDRTPAVELRRRLRGRRWAQLGIGLINLALMVPFWSLTAARFKDALSILSTQLMMSIAAGTALQMDSSEHFLPVAVYFCTLYLPLLPIRRWLTASFALRERSRKADAAPEA